MINVSILKSHHGNIFPQIAIPHLDENIIEFEVEYIDGEYNKGKEYRVKWKNYSKKSWKLKDHL